MTKALMTLALFLSSTAALAADAVEPGYLDAVYGILRDRFPAVIPILLGLMVLCRGLSEILHVIALKTDNKQDDQVAQALGSVARFLGRVFGKAALGTPSWMIDEKVAAVVEGKLSEAASPTASAPDQSA